MFFSLLLSLSICNVFILIYLIISYYLVILFVVVIVFNVFAITSFSYVKHFKLSLCFKCVIYREKNYFRKQQQQTLQHICSKEFNKFLHIPWSSRVIPFFWLLELQKTVLSFSPHSSLTPIVKWISGWNPHIKPPGDIPGIPGAAGKPNASLVLTLLPFLSYLLADPFSPPSPFLITGQWFPLPDWWWWQKQKAATTTTEICCCDLSPTNGSPNTPWGDGQDGWRGTVAARWQRCLLMKIKSGEEEWRSGEGHGKWRVLSLRKRSDGQASFWPMRSLLSVWPLKPKNTRAFYKAGG